MSSVLIVEYRRINAYGAACYNNASAERATFAYTTLFVWVLLGREERRLSECEDFYLSDSSTLVASKLRYNS